MAIVDRRWSALPVPYAMEFPDRAPKERYFDPDFYQMEVEMLWPRVWQMACRLEEIPQPRDFVEYEILDQSVVVVRTDDMGVRAFQNACRHRGVKVVEGRGSCESGFICPFHGWCYGPDGTNTFVTRSKTFAEHNLQPQDLNLTPVRCEMWGGCAWINLDDDAPPLAGVHRAVRHRHGRLEGGVAADRVVVRMPPPRELEAGRRGVHGAVPRGGDASPARHHGAGRVALRAGRSIRVHVIDAEIHYLRTMSEGMDGMVHANDVRVAEGLRDMELPDDPTLAIATWLRTLNDAVVRWHRDAGQRHPRPQRSRGAGPQRADGLLLPALLRAAHVQQRLVVPLPPVGAGGDADGDLVAHAVPGG